MPDQTAPAPMGATFAERKAAADGKKTFTDPRPLNDAGKVQNSTFATRAAAAEKPDGEAKAVGSADAEDKAVKRSTRKSE